MRLLPPLLLLPLLLLPLLLPLLQFGVLLPLLLMNALGWLAACIAIDLLGHKSATLACG